MPLTEEQQRKINAYWDGMWPRSAVERPAYLEAQEAKNIRARAIADKIDHATWIEGHKIPILFGTQIEDPLRFCAIERCGTILIDEEYEDGVCTECRAEAGASI